MYDKRIDTFLAVADLGSFSKAADMLYMSVPALTKQITALEKEYGFPLFIRDARGAHLTKAGLSFYKDAKELLTFSSSAISRALRTRDDLRIQLRIGNEILAPAYHLNRYLELSDLPSKYDLQIYSFTDDFNHSDYLYRKVGVSLDGVATLLIPLHLPPNLSLLPLHKVPIGLFLPVQHPLLSESTIRVSQMNDIPLIIPTRGNRLLDEMSNYLQRVLPNAIIHRPNQFYSIEIFNAGVSENSAVIAPSVWDGIHPSLVFRPIDWDFFSVYSFVYAKDASEETLAFVSDLRNSRNKLAETDPSALAD